MSRPSTDVYMMGLAVLAATRATCCRRRVGCILTSAMNHVLATGYNGVPVGVAHCTQIPCAGATMPSGTGLDLCLATHAEQNALLQCRDVNRIFSCYCTASPCMTCIKLLMNTTCQRLVFLEEYPHPDAKSLWVSTGREWKILSLEEQIKLQTTLTEISRHPSLVIPPAIKQGD